MVASMTGFARQEATHSWGTLSWELRSVNHRYLEPHFRLPDFFRSIEPELRTKLRKGLSRGKVEIALSFQNSSGLGEDLSINTDALQRLADAVRQVDATLPCAPVNPLAVLQWPGVMNTQSADQEEFHNAALVLFDQTLEKLQEHRKREGRELSELIEQRLASIGTHVATVKNNLPGILHAQRTKLTERIQALKEDINQDRLEQELVIYAQKADVDEELDRLVTHVTEVRLALKQSGPIGRRLDFLMQELNREANTLSSKSIAGETTQAAVELKILIEQMREQIQNIE